MTMHKDMIYALGGVPTVGSAEIPTSTGSYFFVNSVIGNNGNAGKTPTQPFATIDTAINKCTADKGDVIIVMPNHAETLADAVSLVPDVSGISIIGLGNATNQPTLTFSATGSEIIVTGANTLIKNIRMDAGVSAVATAVDIDAHNVTLDGCTFLQGSTTTYDFVLSVDVDAFDYATIQNCEFAAEAATAGSTAGIRIDDANNLKIVNNYFHGDFSDSAIANIGADALCANILIAHNLIYNDDTAGVSNCIELANACTGLVAYNACAGLEAGSAVLNIDPGSCLLIQNYGVNAVDQIGLLTGSATAST